MTSRAPGADLAMAKAGAAAERGRRPGPSPRKIIKEEGFDIVRTVVESESNSVPCNRVPSAESSNATRSTRSKRRK